MAVDRELLATTLRARDRLVELQHESELAQVSYQHAIRRLHAAGAKPDGVRKLDAALHSRFGDEANRVRIVRDFSSDQLDLALARPNVVHAALLTGSASSTFLARHARLTRFRTGASSGKDDERRRTVGSEE